MKQYRGRTWKRSIPLLVVVFALCCLRAETTMLRLRRSHQLLQLLQPPVPGVFRNPTYLPRRPPSQAKR
jgi:hypothetical protein